MLLKIVKVYTDTPGGRYELQGPYSGERFRDEFLISAYEASIDNKEKLIVDFDDSYGYGSGFIEESFGGMVRKGYNAKEVLKNTEFVSNDDSELINHIVTYMMDAEEYKKEVQKKK